MVEIITPLLTQLGVGGIAGLCVGYALKKMGKLLAILLGIAFLFLELLAYKGIININYSALEDWAKGMIGQAGAFEGVLTAIIANLPFSASFLVGFTIGFKMG
jgi:uncharacterized membrane protein (Fun14 family)